MDTGSKISLIESSLLQTSLDLRSETKKLSLKLDNGISLGTFPFYPFNFTNTGLQGILGFDFLNKKIFLKNYDVNAL